MGILSEENYQSTKKKISYASLIILLIGLTAGGFIIAASCMISGFVFIISRGREIAAYQAQQIMPIAQEGMKQMAPTVNEVMRESAPVYGEVAKEIAKGVKEGMNKDM